MVTARDRDDAAFDLPAFRSLRVFSMLKRSRASLVMRFEVDRGMISKTAFSSPKSIFLIFSDVSNLDTRRACEVRIETVEKSTSRRVFVLVSLMVFCTWLRSSDLERPKFDDAPDWFKKFPDFKVTPVADNVWLQAHCILSIHRSEDMGTIFGVKVTAEVRSSARRKSTESSDTAEVCPQVKSSFLLVSTIDCLQPPAT